MADVKHWLIAVTGSVMSATVQANLYMCPGVSVCFPKQLILHTRTKVRPGWVDPCSSWQWRGAEKGATLLFLRSVKVKDQRAPLSQSCSTHLHRCNVTAVCAAAFPNQSLCFEEINKPRARLCTLILGPARMYCSLCNTSHACPRTACRANGICPLMSDLKLTPLSSFTRLSNPVFLREPPVQLDLHSHAKADL